MRKYCQRPRRTVAEVLFDFSPIHVPFDYIFDLFPPLQPRSFSIASSLQVASFTISWHFQFTCLSQAHPNEIHLCIAIVKYKTILKKIRRGVLTKWMATLQKGKHKNAQTKTIPETSNEGTWFVGYTLSKGL